MSQKSYLIEHSYGFNLLAKWEIVKMFVFLARSYMEKRDCLSPRVGPGAFFPMEGFGYIRAIPTSGVGMIRLQIYLILDKS